MKELTFLDLSMITQISILVVASIQYFKKFIPEWLVKPYLQGALGIVFSYLIQAYLGAGSINWVFTLVNGLLAGMVAEGGYQVLNEFGLRSKEEMKE